MSESSETSEGSRAVRRRLPLPLVTFVQAAVAVTFCDRRRGKEVGEEGAILGE